MYTELPKKCQGLALVLSLEGEAQEAVLKTPENDIASQNGVDVIINCLSRLYKKDSKQSKNTKYRRLLKHLGNHVTCQYNHFLMNLKKDFTKPSHMVLKCLKTS